MSPPEALPAKPKSGQRVAVLMGTFNGGRFLDEQLGSIEAQTHELIDIHVSDDGSTDETLEVISSWRGRWKKGNFTLVNGPRTGFAENYRSLILARTDADYVAFADQDDVWEPNRLAEGLEWMQSGSVEAPKLFASRTRLIADDGRVLGLSPLFTRPPSFRNALVQSIGGGNTMLLNRRAFELLALSCRRAPFLSHDWWAYVILSGAGAEVFYSPKPLVRYRQHGANAHGQNISIAARLVRARMLLAGEFRTWTTSNLEGLAKNLDLLTQESREVYGLFLKSRSGNVISRLGALRAAGIYRQTTVGTLALALTTALGRF